MGSQCTFWCSVLSDQKGDWIDIDGGFRLNAPFGAQCFPTQGDWRDRDHTRRLNAPFGAQCFPTYILGTTASDLMRSQCTFWCSVLSDLVQPAPSEQGRSCLNAPFGAQCFPTGTRVRARYRYGRLNAPFGAQCFPTLNIILPTMQVKTSQCTFWCSVLSDWRATRQSSTRAPVSMHLLVLSAFRLDH